MTAHAPGAQAARSAFLSTRLDDFDPEIATAVSAEPARQRGTLEMNASENFAPLTVMQAQGSVLTDKYAESYPGRRCHGGCEHVDTIERIAVERVRALFGAEAANVQPHSGAQANAAAMISSGVRVGTPALAARGFGAPEFAEVADIVATAFLPGFDDRVAAGLRRRVQHLTDRFPPYPGAPDFPGSPDSPGSPVDPQLVAEEAAQ
nr:hypothetical protein [Streptomyces humi]